MRILGCLLSCLIIGCGSGANGADAGGPDARGADAGRDGQAPRPDGDPGRFDAAGWPDAGPMALPLQGSVSQFGITWTFSEPVPVGQFVNGDYYVVGPFTITAIDPPPGGGRNGSVLNLPADQNQTGFDDRTEAGRYDASLAASLPIDMVPGDKLVSSISVDTIGVLPRMLRTEDASTSPVETAAVLTCLEAPVPVDAFRPSYGDPDTRIYLARDLRRDLLPSLPRVASTPDLAEWERIFERPWIDNLFFGFDAPVLNMPGYGREVARGTSMASLMLMVDFTFEQKERLLVRFVQYGIDLWGLLRAGYPGWQAHGGHGNGRKWAIVLSGMLLGDAEMSSPTRTFSSSRFSEDMQTIYGTGWTGATVVYGGHVGPDGEMVNPGWGPYEHLDPSAWLGDAIGESYRRCCTSIAWIGSALAARLMDAQTDWNHDAFFDYADRWMTEDDSAAVDDILRLTGHDYRASWARQGQCWDAFVEEMWAAYR